VIRQPVESAVVVAVAALEVIEGAAVQCFYPEYDLA
jgi:hypothetical protein